MTKREAFNEVLANETISAEVKAIIDKEIAIMDARNEKRKGVQSKKSAENAVKRQAIYDYLTTLENPVSIKEIDESGAFPDMTKGQITALLTRLVADERVTREQIKKVNYYAVA
jgi:hypothetical protein